MKRRDFLKTSGSFVVIASVGGVGAACGGGGGGGPDANQTGLFAFPQGVASGDPQPSSVMLWTRVEAASGATDDIKVTMQLSTSTDFSSPMSSHDVTASASSDFTLRLLVTGLSADTVYYYRFVAGVDASDTGRTWTAPASDADVPITLAWVSCQDYEAGFHGAFKQMLTDDGAAAAADKIRAVVHLGDFIYETRGAQFSRPLDDLFHELNISDRNGKPRVIDAFPSGGGNAGGYNYAKTLADYRHLYKQYLRDPDLRAARAQWPFIHTWDDHEFTNDCWQSEANYTDQQSLDEPSQTRKVAANQAWFEFVPALLSDAPGMTGVPNQAKDFVAATVTDTAFGTTVDDNNLATETNNVAALGTITLYRSLRLGKHVDLVMTDLRSYRSDHAIPEEELFNITGFFDPRNVLLKDMVNTMDAGKLANGGNPPDTFYNGQFQNPRKAWPPGTMLGKPQKDWWKATMSASTATWRIWGNEVPLMRMLLNNPSTGILLFDRLMDCDAWDGYNYERVELMTYLRDQGIRNTVVITGDVHANFAGIVMDDYEATTPTPIAAELIAAGISSNSLFSFYEKPTRTQPPAVRQLITYDATLANPPGTNKYVNNINLGLLHGFNAANTMADTNDINQAMANADAGVNTHIRFADSDAQGYGLLSVTATGCTGTLVKVVRPVVDNVAGPGVAYKATFTIPLQGANDPASISDPVFTGAKPFPYDPTT